MNNKLTIALLGIILITMVVNSFRSCGQEKKLESVYEKQIALNDSLSKKIEDIAKSRIDSVWVIEKEMAKRNEEKKERKNEVFNATNIDSVLKLYYYNRPDKADSTH